MIRDVKATATDADAGERLDKFLVAQYKTTRALAREAIARGDVLLCGKPAEKGARLRAGDEIAVSTLLEEEDASVTPDPSVAVSVVFDDGILLAADKPAGMPVQPLSPYELGTLANGVVALRPEFSIIRKEPLSAGAVHRIDAGTSGLVIFAANGFAFATMRSLFSTHKVVKTYLALVEGVVERPGTISCDLAHAPRSAFCKMVEHASLSAAERARERPLHAETSWRPIGTRAGRTLLEVEILTGVTHQIRAQLALAGHPIAGDAIYGGGNAGGTVPEGCFCLHSLAAEFDHPSTGERLLIKTPPPRWAK